MDIKEKFNGTPREILISSSMLLILALFRFMPGGVLDSVPYSGFFSALLSNSVSMMTLVGAGFPYNGYILGVLLVGVIASTAFLGKKSYSVHFLTTASLAFYGLFTLTITVIYPSVATDLEVLGLGVQVIFLGLAATETYKKVLNTDIFPHVAHRTGLTASVWQFVAGIALLSSFQFLSSYQAYQTATLGLLAVLGLLGLAMLYSAIELTFNTAEGFWTSMLFLSALMLASISTKSIVGALVPFGLMVILWMTKEKYGVEDHPFVRFTRR